MSLKTKVSKKTKPWWSEGVRFECQGSGQCCLSRDEYGHVYLTPKDQRKMARFFGLTHKDFLERYCETHNGHVQLKEEAGRLECMFLKSNRCTVYEARPTQCRTWPFWPEHMGAKKWAKEVAQFCPGVGKGPIISAQTIKKILKEQSRADGEI